ncbi:MAG: cell division protein SepF [Bacteroidales bacterium]|nr:cell division protein SepF [Bacteroidales bacterium]
MKANKTVFACILYALLLSSCIPGFNGGTGDGKSKVKMSADVLSINGNAVEILVRHDGAASQEWSYTVIENLEIAAADAAAIAAAKLTADDVKVGKTAVVNLEGLKEETKYRFIPYALDGTSREVTGTPADVQFTTGQDLASVIFSGQLVSVDRNLVKLSVSNSKGLQDITWYAFVSDNLDSSASLLVNSNTRNLKDSDLSSGSGVEVTFSDLKYNTSYRLIVTGYANGAAYGTPADVPFTTGEQYVKNEAIVLTPFDSRYYVDGYWKTALSVEGIGESDSYGMIQLEKADFDVASIGSYIEEDYAALVAECTADEGSLEKYFYSSPGGWYRPYDGPGEYVEIVYMLNDKLEISGDYNYIEVSFAPAETSAEYEAWVGTWLLNGSDITVYKYAPGELYIITNLFPDSPTLYVVGAFNPENGSLVLSKQNLGYFNHNSYGKCSIDMVGWFPYNGTNYYYAGDRAIATATLNGDGTATLNPEPAASYGTFTEIGVYWSIMEGDLAGRGNNYSGVRIALPSTLTKPAETASDAYNAWVGTWTVERPECDTEGNPTGNAITDQWIISPKVNDVSLLISGIDGKSFNEVVAVFDSESGKISVSEQFIGSYENEGVEFGLYLMGMFDKDGDYGIWGGTAPVFEGVINPDGTASLSGLTYEYTKNDGTAASIDFTAYSVYVVNETTGSLAGYYFENWGEFNRLPATLTPYVEEPASVRKPVRSTATKVTGAQVPSRIVPASGTIKSLVPSQRVCKAGSANAKANAAL